MCYSNEGDSKKIMDSDVYLRCDGYRFCFLELENKQEYLSRMLRFYEGSFKQSVLNNQMPEVIRAFHADMRMMENRLIVNAQLLDKRQMSYISSKLQRNSSDS